jgi:ABC-type transport system involved in multi-copper enzyme maturation permease subunit
MAQSTSSLQYRIMQQPWGLWWMQALRLTRIEVRRNLFSWKASWIYFLAFIPTFIILIHTLLAAHIQPTISGDTLILAGIIQFYYVRLGIFFGCLGIFSRLIRGEMIERSLHFYFLSPVRREVILLAKFAAGSISALLLFGSAIIADLP